MEGRWGETGRGNEARRVGGGGRDVEWGEIGGTLSAKTVSPERPLAPMRVWRIAFACVWCGGACLRAADEPAKAPSDKAPAAQSLPGIFVPKAPSKKASAPRRAGAPSAAPSRRAISPEMAAKISEVAKQAAPPPKSGETTRSVEAEGASDAVQLEAFVVEEEKYPDFKEREILTRKGKLEEALKRHPGLRLGPIPLGNDQVARDMLEDEFRRQRIEEMKELSGLMSVGKDAVPRGVKKVMDETRMQVMRPRDEKLFPDREK